VTFVVKWVTVEFCKWLILLVSSLAWVVQGSRLAGPKEPAAMASYDFVLWRMSGGLRLGFTVEAVSQDDAERVLAARMLATGYSPRDLLRWSIGSVAERRGAS
jgi:hypothetical protein